MKQKGGQKTHYLKILINISQQCCEIFYFSSKYLATLLKALFNILFFQKKKHTIALSYQTKECYLWQKITQI